MRSLRRKQTQGRVIILYSKPVSTSISFQASLSYDVIKYNIDGAICSLEESISVFAPGARQGLEHISFYLRTDGRGRMWTLYNSVAPT